MRAPILWQRRKGEEEKLDFFWCGSCNVTSVPIKSWNELHDFIVVCVCASDSAPHINLDWLMSTSKAELHTKIFHTECLSNTYFIYLILCVELVDGAGRHVVEWELRSSSPQRPNPASATQCGQQHMWGWGLVMTCPNLEMAENPLLVNLKIVFKKN